MTTFFQPRLLHIFAAVGLAVLSGCKGGIGRSMPDVSMPSIFARGNERKAPAEEPKLPSPDVTERNYAQVQMAMGDNLAKEGNFEAAQSAYEAAIRNDDSLARAYHRLALMNEKTGKGSDAQGLFLQAMKLDPKNAEIACDYGYYCYLRQDWKEAQSQFEHALQLDPELKRAHNNLGLVYARTDRAQEALQQFASSGLSPADARANLGFVYLTQQRFPEAKAELQMAANATPASEKARGILARFEKIESSAQPAPSQHAAEMAPAEKPPIRNQFDVSPASAVEARRLPETTVPHLAKVDAPRQETVASTQPSERPTEQPAANQALPTQQHAPVLSDYQF